MGNCTQVGPLCSRRLEEVPAPGWTEAEADNLVEDNQQRGEDGTVQRLLAPGVDSHKLFEEDKSPVLEAGTPAGWGCTEQPLSISREAKHTHTES